MLSEVRFAATGKWAKIPEWGSADAAGADLYACLHDGEYDRAVIAIEPGETVQVPVGIKSEFAPGYAAFIFARSGLATKKGLAPANKVGVIDADYRGEWLVALHNHSDEVQIIADGERIAQVVFQKVEHPEFITVPEEELSSTARGEGGFGSTGEK
jgi:dUTP pyrophosphatase